MASRRERAAFSHGPLGFLDACLRGLGQIVFAKSAVSGALLLLGMLAASPWLAASAALHAQDATAPQSWTASDGRVIQAKFIKLDGESVVIEKNRNHLSLP